jgi:NAD+ synthase
MKDRVVDLSIQVKLAHDILVHFLRAETRKVGFRKLVIGVSGGLDSALVAYLAVNALGRDNVLLYFLPYRASDPQSAIDAQEVAHFLSVPLHVLDISPAIDTYFAQEPEADKLRRGNKMARERMSVLFDQSMAERALVVGASNKSELLLGYATWYGDMAASLLPIGDLYKTQIRQMARELQLPAPLIDKPPSADLWSGQTDEDELGFSYELADQILFLYADERYREEEILHMGYSAEIVGKIIKRCQRYQFKRRMPPICKLSGRTIGWDFRYLRDWGR